MYFQKEVYAKETDVEPNSEIKISNAEKINNIDSVIEQNVNAKMVFFDFSLKMIVLLKQ